MKKFYALVAAALFSVATFASREVVPSDADLASYATGTYTMCIYNEAACNGIVLNGTYAGWPNDPNHPNLLDFVAVTGFEGWYVVSWNDTTGAEAKDGGVQAKPIQLDGTGKFNWDYQLGNDAELIRGTEIQGKPIMNLNGNEVDIKNLQPGITVIDVKSWKANPCTAIYHVYNITLISPDCNEEDYITPAISGGFNGWAQEAMTMNELKTAERQQADLPGAVFEYSTKAAEGSDFKFRSAAEWGAEWTNQLKEYDTENDEWKAFNNGQNIVFGTETNLVYDLGDPDLYSWDNCEKPEEKDSTVYKVFVGVKVPQPTTPIAGVEIMGDFIEDGWNTGVVLTLNPETGWYVTSAVTAMEFNVFKFREAGTWNNEIVYADQVKDEKPVGLDNIKFSDVWTDETYKGEPYKWIELDYSNATKYVWKADWVAPEGIENVVLTEKARKVVVDGVIYIVRDNKLFNLQGAQVR